MLKPNTVSSGIPALDQVIMGLRLGDNVVWQVDSLENYRRVVDPFVTESLSAGRKFVHVRFAPHETFLSPKPGIIELEVDPRPGFDSFSGQVNMIIEENGLETFYVFDNLSSLVADWATDELLANFFQVTCPYLRELETVAYFALTRGQHLHGAVARIRDTTQVLIDLYHIHGQLYIHPLKVWDRYSSQMFLPHRYTDGNLEPIFQSCDASSISLTASKNPLRVRADSIAPWDSVYRKLSQYSEEELGLIEHTPEIQALKQELSQMIIGAHPDLRRLADHYLTVEDLFQVRNRLIGSGRVGGKAAGMLLARAILKKEPGGLDFSELLEEHDSFYIGSDVFFTFLINNDLFRLRLRLTRDSQISPEEYERAEERFLAGRFPDEIMEQFKDLMEYFGQAPIIVRSSSLLEDGFGNAFAGKYRSEFCVNQGSPEQRLEAFLRAVKLVYASAINPDALAYRKQRGLGEADEQMAILVQRVSGMCYRNFFFPPMAGVAFSHNLYRWTDRIDPEQGIVRLVFGLGTRAVNRVGGDYPRLIALSHPRLRPEVGSKILTYSQREIDLLDLKENDLKTRLLSEVLGEASFPHLQLYVSTLQDGYVSDPECLHLEDMRRAVMTFNTLISQTEFVRIMRELLAKLESAYGHPVDTEFTASLASTGSVSINLVQCRPMRLPGTSEAVVAPPRIPKELVLFRASRTISGGTLHNIGYIVYIDPKSYAEKASLEVKQSLGRIIGELNRNPEIKERRVMMMGPGRWGSTNIMLGVNTSYADISNASVLVEMAREQAGHIPDVSYGTHFFLDIVESRMIYLPLYPDDPKSDFNFEFFESSPNSLGRFLRGADRFEEFVKVIDVPMSAGNRVAHVMADPRKACALCWLHAAEPEGQPEARLNSPKTDSNA
ncbi:MAG: PEP/pyruvate-binding domain-containing protein [Syntrophobacteraceae bacterium]|nr:PEP/pyruvate-binding domain-containing protein [Syntrophobacteraceae bacterium]